MYYLLATLSTLDKNLSLCFLSRYLIILPKMVKDFVHIPTKASLQITILIHTPQPIGVYHNHVGEPVVTKKRAFLPLRSWCGNNEPSLYLYAKPLAKFTSNQFFKMAGASYHHTG